MAPHCAMDETALSMLEDILQNYEIINLCIVLIILIRLRKLKSRKNMHFRKAYKMKQRMPSQVEYMTRLTGVTDYDCLANLRMDRNTFGRLCRLFRQLGTLRDKRYMSIEEQVAMFLGILAHHEKNRVVKFKFLRSGHTVSKYIHKVLNAVLNMHSLFLVNPDPIPEDCIDPRWKWFKVMPTIVYFQYI